MKHLLDINNCVNIYRHANGIKLVEAGKSQPARHTVSSMLQSAFDVYFLDRNSVILGINEETVKICKFLSIKDAIGKTVRYVFKKESAEAMLNNDMVAMSNNIINITDDTIERFDDVSYAALSVKCPWYDNDNKIIGLFGCSIVIGEQSFSSSLKKITELGLLASSNGTGILPGSYIHNVYLTKRENEVAHHVKYGKTAKHI